MIAGCLWLPRLLAKARQLGRGELPSDYVARFCHASGVDGVFLRHFGLSRDDVMAAAALPDSAIEAWLLARPGVTPAKIAEWNRIGPNLGRAGFPMAERLPIAMRMTYQHLADRGLNTVFDVLEADESGP